MKYQAGDIVFQKSANSLFSKLIIKFTDYVLPSNQEGFAHSMYVTSTNYLECVTVESAERTVGLKDIESFSRFDVYRIKHINTGIMMMVLQILFRDAEKKYNKLQLLYFGYRYLVEKILKKKIDLRNSKNRFPNGPICSERVYRLLTLYFAFLSGHTDAELKVKKQLLEYNENVIQPNDLLKIVLDNPQVFEFIGDKGK